MTLGLAVLLLSPTTWADDDPADDSAAELPEQPPAPSGAIADSPPPEPPTPKGPRVIWQNATPPGSEPFLPDTAHPPRVEEPAKVTRWYGGQTLAVDAASIGAVVLGASSQAVPLAALGFGGYLLGGPIVHFSHGNGGRGLASLTLRIGLPVLGVWAGCGTGGGGPCYGGVAGAALGVGAAIVVDSALLARDEVPAPPATARVTPLLRVSQSGVRLGLGGSF
jgi:hypothetical protein